MPARRTTPSQIALQWGFSGSGTPKLSVPERTYMGVGSLVTQDPSPQETCKRLSSGGSEKGRDRAGMVRKRRVTQGKVFLLPGTQNGAEGEEFSVFRLQGL